jgi:hypothetical protein
VVHPGRGRRRLAGGHGQEIDQVATGPELDELGGLVDVVEPEPKDGRVEALGGSLIPDAQDDMVQLEDVDRRLVGRTRHRLETQP